MKKYNFDEVHSRLHTGSLKWNVAENELPMWVADMDFQTCPEITKALQARVASGIYGYTEPDEEWYESYISFYRDRHHVSLEKDWMAFTTGVVPIMSSTVRKLTREGDNVVILTPVYNIFFNSIVNNHRNVLQVPLLYQNNEYSIDWENLEKAFSLEQTTLMIFCNPANPVSKIWTREELAKVGQLAAKYHVIVLSDEIHCDLVRPEKEYIPFISVNEVNRENCVMAIAPTKTFNLAGIQTACVVVPNEDLRKKVVRQLNTDEVAEPNIFACLAAKTAFNQGRVWLDELREYLFENRAIVRDYLESELPQLKLVDGDATYLLWINIDALKTDSTTFTNYLRQKTGLYVSEGKIFGGNGDHFFRLNVACPQATLLEGLTRLKEGVEEFIASKQEA